MKIPFLRKKTEELLPISPNREAGKRLLTYQTACFQGIGRRDEQQDAYALLNGDDVVSIKQEGLFALVADGMGGMTGGREASETVIASLRSAFDGMNREEDLALQLKDAVKQAGEQVYEKLRERGGSTVIACLFYQEHLYYASVGDSSLFLLRDGELTQLNRAQNSLQREYARTVCRGSMDPAPARESSEQEALTHYVGMSWLDDVDFFRRPLKLLPGDLILACSDGVSGYLSPAELHSCLTSGTPRDICSQLEDAIIRTNHPYQDNYTAVVVYCRY